MNHLGTTTTTEAVGSGFLSEDDPLDRAIVQMILVLAATGVARVPRPIGPLDLDLAEVRRIVEAGP